MLSNLKPLALIVFVAVQSIALAHDGTGLAPKPAPYTQQELDAIYAAGKKACDTECVTPFGTILGIESGVEAKSNCRSECITSQYLFLNTETKNFSVFADDPKKPNEFYVGMIYQCIEYSRKWWLHNLGLTYGSVDGASDIIYLEEAQRVTGEKVKLEHSVNGTAQRAPKRGDLLVYESTRSIPEWRFGHVAVVVKVDSKKGFVEVAEENYDNKKWKGKSYARRLELVKTKAGFRVNDTEITDRKKKEKGTGKIAGWIYPVL